MRFSKVEGTIYYGTRAYPFGPPAHMDDFSDIDFTEKNDSVLFHKCLAIAMKHAGFHSSMALQGYITRHEKGCVTVGGDGWKIVASTDEYQAIEAQLIEDAASLRKDNLEDFVKDLKEILGANRKIYL